ncbi:MAG: hypothetical protein CW346_04495 [Bacillaceae bacterium]|nr:hypothetical protein [Bacillaceae bacterium]
MPGPVFQIGTGFLQKEPAFCGRQVLLRCICPQEKAEDRSPGAQLMRKQRIFRRTAQEIRGISPRIRGRKKSSPGELKRQKNPRIIRRGRAAAEKTGGIFPADKKRKKGGIFFW